MQVYCLYQDNALRNFNYILVCQDTHEAVVIDPLDGARCLALAQQHQFTITTIINTHEHWDHIAGNDMILQATGAEIIAHQKAKIRNMARGVHAGELIEIGKTIQLWVLDTPGHTFSHICLLSKDDLAPSIFSGDTLFNAGCGNCHGGDVDLLFKTVTEQLYKLHDETRIFPGHDYLANNLGFAQRREPHNNEIKHWLLKAKEQDPHHPIITTIGIEKKINPFFRLSAPDIIQQLRHDIPNLSTEPSQHEVFVCLRELRNLW